uniref:MIP06502p n=1 Tax=Drosophila melanogaster TaxID=7227 RepID=C0P8P6_DROME|nr:MIP06502p [Drosophila melanogaster]
MKPPGSSWSQECPTQLPQEPNSACNKIRAVCHLLRDEGSVRRSHKHSLMARGQVDEAHTHCNLMLTSSVCTFR